MFNLFECYNYKNHLFQFDGSSMKEKICCFFQKINKPHIGIGFF